MISLSNGKMLTWELDAETVVAAVYRNQRIKYYGRIETQIHIESRMNVDIRADSSMTSVTIFSSKQNDDRRYNIPLVNLSPHTKPPLSFEV